MDDLYGRLQHTLLAQVARRAKRPLSDVRLTDRLVEDLALDSLNIVEIMLTVEETYNISVSDTALVRANTVAELGDAAWACLTQGGVQ